MQNQTSIGGRPTAGWHRRAGLATVVVLAFILIGFFIAGRQDEPSYGGKSLTQWLLYTNEYWVFIPNDVYGHIHDELWSQLVENMNTSNAVPIDTWKDSGVSENTNRVDAIRAMGTNAIPQLIWLMSSKPGVWAKIQDLIAARLPQKWGDFVYPIHSRDLTERRNVAALEGFTILGTNAEPALPALSNLLFQGRDTLLLTWAIANIGPKGIGLLTNALERNSHRLVDLAALALGLQYEDAKSAAPELLNCVERGNASYDVLGALGRIGCDDPRLVPALMRSLNQKGEAIKPGNDQYMIFLLLGLQREKARAAAPLVIAQYRLRQGNAGAAADRRFFRRILRAVASDQETRLPSPLPDEESETWP